MLHFSLISDIASFKSEGDELQWVTFWKGHISSKKVLWNFWEVFSKVRDAVIASQNSFWYN